MSQISEATKATIQTALELWGKLPTTQARVSFTLVCVLGTAVRYWMAGPEGWEPSEVWLIFLAGMSGLDLAQFHFKRTTDMGYVAATKGAAAP